MLDRIVINSVITGLHETKVGAQRDVRLLVEADDSVGDIDPECMLVRAPSLEQIPPHLHYEIAYPKSRNPKSSRQKNQLIGHFLKTSN